MPPTKFDDSNACIPPLQEESGGEEPNALFTKRCATRLTKGVQKGVTRKTPIFLRDSAGERAIFSDFSTTTGLVRGLLAMYNGRHLTSQGARP